MGVEINSPSISNRVILPSMSATTGPNTAQQRPEPYSCHNSDSNRRLSGRRTSTKSSRQTDASRSLHPIVQRAEIGGVRKQREDTGRHVCATVLLHRHVCAGHIFTQTCLCNSFTLTDMSVQECYLHRHVYEGHTVTQTCLCNSVAFTDMSVQQCDLHRHVCVTVCPAQTVHTQSDTSYS